jgi:hypothetical protein
MPGESAPPDPLYVLARGVLLDALDALGDQRDAVILVGAQAIYLHTGAAELAVAEFTTDSDLGIDPGALKSRPELGEALGGAGFSRSGQPGTWVAARRLEGRPVTVDVDLMVPEALGGGGRRGARLPEPHGNRAARKARGLEAALVDREVREIGALDERDTRRFRVAVAGPAALLVAKLHKIHERVDAQRLASDKDALDVLRLLRAVPTETFAGALDRLREDPLSAEVTEQAISYLRELFSSPGAPGSSMAARAASPLEPEDVISGSCAVLSQDLLGALE